MKKFLILLMSFIVVLALVLTACEHQNEKRNSNEDIKSEVLQDSLLPDLEEETVTIEESLLTERCEDRNTTKETSDVTKEHEKYSSASPSSSASKATAKSTTKNTTVKSTTTKKYTTQKTTTNVNKTKNVATTKKATTTEKSTTTVKSATTKTASTTKKAETTTRGSIMTLEDAQWVQRKANEYIKEVGAILDPTLSVERSSWSYCQSTKNYTKEVALEKEMDWIRTEYDDCIKAKYKTVSMYCYLEIIDNLYYFYILYD